MHCIETTQKLHRNWEISARLGADGGLTFYCSSPQSRHRVFSDVCLCSISVQHVQDVQVQVKVARQHLQRHSCNETVNTIFYFSEHACKQPSYLL